jgi:hypothetical protein
MMATVSTPAPANIRPADFLKLRLGIDYPTLTAAYCRWRAEDLFPLIFHRYPQMSLVDFLDWNYRPTVEPVGCFIGEVLVGIGWIVQARQVNGQVVAEVGAAFFKGTPLTVWRRGLDLLLQYAFDSRDFAEVYGVSARHNRFAALLTHWCGMREVSGLPWPEEEIEADTAVFKLDRSDYGKRRR